MADQRLVIVNTTPLINFAQIGRLDLLQHLFGEVVLPPAVVAELSAKCHLFPLADDVPNTAFVRVATPMNAAVVATLTLDLHLGEAECLALALEQHAKVLLVLDDLAARQAAGHHHLSFTGTVGCLTLAKRRGLISEVAPLLDDLRHLARFWLTEDLIQAILKNCGERT